MKRYAEGTKVAVPRSRGQIDKLLRDWGAKSISWTDNSVNGDVSLRFVWASDSGDFIARFDLDGPTDCPESKKALRIREAHRLLFLWIKAALNAIDAGLVEPEAIFLPFIERANGTTVAETFVSQLQKITSGSGQLLLGDGRSS